MISWKTAVIHIALVLIGTEVNAQQLILVHVAWRHGDRTPTESFLNKTESARIWPEGNGELTKVGMMQQFHLGELLKVKYVDGHRLLNKEYRASEIYARSSDYNRTLMSAYATLAGLYYPTDKTKMPSRWPSDLAWQPIPVHTAIKKSDPLMWVNYDCPKAKAVYNEVVASHPFITYNNMNKNLFAYLSVKSGMGTVNLTNLWRLHDILHVQKISNLSWPTWLNAVEELNMTNNTMYEKINNLNELAMQFLLHDEKIVQFRGGFLLKDIVDRMKAKVSKKLDEDLKLYAYSGHDLTLVSLLEALRAYPKKIPQYSACIAIELWRRNSDHFIKVLYRPGYETPEFKDLTTEVLGCADSQKDLGCPFTTFIDSIQPLLYPGGNFDQNCRTDGTVDLKKSEEFYKTVTIVVAVLLGFFVLLSLLFLWLYLRAQNASGRFRFNGRGTYSTSSI